MVYMSIKIKRIQSLESGPFNNFGGRVRFNVEVPASLGFTDLQNSQVVFRMNAYCESNGIYGTKIPVALAEENSVNNITDIGGCQALIKNARVTSKAYGLMNEQRDQNVVNANLDYYLNSTADQYAMQTFNGGGLKYGDHTTVADQVTPWLDLSRPKEVGVAVTDVEPTLNHYAEVRCPLKHIDRFADGIRQFPNLAVGDITYQVDLEDVRDLVCAVPPTAQVAEDLTAVNSEFGTDLAPILYRPGNGEPYQQNNFNQIPFWIDQPLELTYKEDGNDETHQCVVSYLKVTSTGDLEIRVTPAAPTPTSATAAVTNLLLTTKIDTGAIVVRWDIQDIFVELHCLQLLPTQLEAAKKAMANLQIPWMDHRLVKKVLNLTGDYSETLQLDQSCAGVAILTPINNQFVSQTDDAKYYRFSIDGKLTTDRDIVCGPITTALGEGVSRQLHNHMLGKFFANIGKTLKKYDMPALAYGANATAFTHHFYPLVTPMLPRDQLVNFQVRTTGADMSTKEVFYVSVHARVLSFKNGRLMA